MNKLLILKTSLNAIIRHTGRSLLTVIGIMIGIAAIVITFAIGRGAEEKIKKQIMWMGEGSCYIVSGNVITRGAARAALFKPIRMTVDDMHAIKAEIPEIKDISRSTYTLEMIEYMGKATRDRVLGTDANMLKINKNKLRYGAMFTPTDVANRINVAVLGEKIADKLFDAEFPIGKTIRINGNPFTIIGVIEHQEHFFGPDDPNARVFVPFTVGKKLFSKENESEDDLSAIALHFYPDVHSAKPLRLIKRILRTRHGLDDKEEDDFTIFDEETIKKTAEDAAGVIKLFGLIAASISLIVGGIGVMNIMLVSVQERTKEIGLRMAIGATQAVIQLQFLLEAIILCALGGIIGIIIGLLGLQIVGHLTNLNSIIEFTPLMISFLITIVVGIFFGYYPARAASLLNPIDALLER
jgi:putative ABC transport system permease protein